MNVDEILAVLEQQMKVAVFATIDDEGKPHSRFAHIGVANQKGIFFMTGEKTHFYQQLTQHPEVAITAMKEEEYLIQVIRIEGKVKEVGKKDLETLLKGNPYVKYVYPTDSEKSNIHVFQLYEGEGFYQSLTQGHHYTFTIGH